ncbi:hypothetical protein C6I20_04005 [Aeromicrobium sp. A1-2]|uniref:hypothetical protein n=1 Tax=Aeromicrobium sp. A1-2 TaxID=2107713 RepID=UPI000E49033A|nr:hypothetical protein [Aeromicrobium sp. A1-2]AXT84439.1 hypothetical protein C6I20_04005 [Aeromicrobium sp. A1-2]
MKIISTLRDNRINASNVLIEMGLSEYAELVKANLQNNEFQRKRVSSSKTVYSLLKSDLLIGCVIPPVVLALNSEAGLADSEKASIDVCTILDNSSSIVILDGLQRTYTILDLLDELDGSPEELARVAESKMRVEVYVGLNRLGILYRMLTLNTGQTPMSLRQQIEMLYSDYIGANVGNIELLRESDGKYATQENQYVFKDVVEGFNAYLNRDELPFDRSGLLENIRSLEKLSKLNQNTEIFEDYIGILDAFVRRANDQIGGTKLPDDWHEESATPFGRTVSQVFKKAQAMSGLGAAIGKHIDREVLGGLGEARELVERVVSENPEDFLIDINASLDWLKNNTSKIGNAQRNFFTFFFRDLLNDESDTFLNLEQSAGSALRKYQDQNV